MIKVIYWKIYYVTPPMISNILTQKFIRTRWVCPAIFTGVYIVLYNLIFFLTPIFKILIFFPTFSGPGFPLPHLIFFPTVLIWKGRRYCFPFPFFQRYILPHSLDIPFPCTQLDIFPQQGGNGNSKNPWFFYGSGSNILEFYDIKIWYIYDLSL